MFPNLISWCWYLFAVFWVINMFSNKPTVRRQPALGRLSYTVPFLVAGWLLAARSTYRGIHPLDWIILPRSLALDLVSVALTALGLAFAIWARVTLGRNWSGTITFKQDHELILTGPYAWVRHPIYTGIVSMFLGTALASGIVGPLLSVPLIFLSFWIKYLQEEALMIEHFGMQYRDYMGRVRAIIPWVF